MRKTLKQLREESGLTQADVAKRLNTTGPIVCNYELGQSEPPLEDMIILERHFDQRIQWGETLTDRQKEVIVNSLVTLMQDYPLSTVLNFATKNLREGIRLGRPELLIRFYADASSQLNIEPLLPQGLKFKTN